MLSYSAANHSFAIKSQPTRRRFLGVSRGSIDTDSILLTDLIIFFSGRYKDKNAEAEPNSRFDTSLPVATVVRRLYFSDKAFGALDIISKAAEAQGLTMGETALRWINWHSALKPEHGDAIIIGASSTKHIEENLANLEKGPLPDSVVKAIEEAWKIVGGDNFVYWH